MTAAAGPPRCSAKGCSLPATWALLWRNPRIHTDDRRKTWLACDDHRVTLEEFLSLRGFPLEIEPFTPPHGQPEASFEA